MKILEATYLSITSDPRAKKFADTLSKDHDVTVLDLGSKKDIKGYNVISKKKLKNPIISVFSFWFSILKTALKLRPDIIIAHNYYNVFPVWIAALITGSHPVYDSYEFYVPSRSQKLSKRSYFFYILEKIAIKRYPTIFSANDERSRLMKVKFNLRRLPTPILNISDNVNLVDIPIDKLKKKYPTLSNFLDEGKIIVYQGFISIERQIDKYLDLIKCLPNNFKLLYLGDGPDLDLIRSRIEEMNLSNRALAFGRIEMIDVVPFVRNCAYGIVTYPFEDYNNRYCSPNKIFEYSLAHLPFISSAQTTTMNIMKDVDYVCYIDICDVKVSAKKIEDFDKTFVKNESSFDSFNERYNWDVEKYKILNVINSI